MRLSALSDAASVNQLGMLPDVLSVHEPLSLPAPAAQRTPWLYARVD